MARKIRVPVFRAEQPIGTFFVGVMPAVELLAICEFDYRRIRENDGYKDFLGIQRQLKSDRVSAIRKYINTSDATFPTSIVVSIDDRCATFVHDHGCATLEITEYLDEESPEMSITLENAASIIDGQHRLKAFDADWRPEKFDISVSFFIGVDDATEATVFSTVNLAQTKVNKSLVYDLFSLEKSRSPERTCHEIAVAMDRLPESPFFERIKRLGTTTEGRIDETLSQATFVRGLLPFITNDPVTDRDIGKRFGFWDPAPARRERQQFFRPYFTAGKDERILANMMNYFGAVRECWPRAWEGSIEGGMLNKTNGYNALMRFLREVYHEIAPEELDIIERGTFLGHLESLGIREETLTVDNYRPGSSGASSLYRRLHDELRGERGR